MPDTPPPAKDSSILDMGATATLPVHQALRNEQRFSEAIMESMPGVVYLYTHQGTFLRWNRNFERASGYTSDEISRMQPLDFFPSSSAAQVRGRIDAVFLTGQGSLDAPLRAKDGQLTQYHFTGRRVSFAGEECLVGVGIDVSDRDRAQAGLTESEAHLLDAQRIAGIGSWQLRVATGELTWSRQTYEIFGVEPNTPCNYQRFMSFVHPNDRARLAAAQERVLAGTGTLDVEHRIVLPDGTEKHVHERAQLVRHTSSATWVLAGTVHDITDRVHVQGEREKRLRAEAADRVKSAFLATMSHELRTPLNSIIGFTGILAQGLAGPINSEQSKQLNMVRASARHLLALVNDVLDISKIEAGQLDLARRTVDVRQCIDRVQTAIAAQAHAKGLVFTVTVAPDVSTVMGDSRRLEQVLLNLLDNAIRFTDHGSVQLMADVLSRTVETEAIHQLQLSVSDTGIGIAAEDFPKLFEPFVQIDSGLTRRHDGTGLGLSISRRLLELMGGTITVESQLDRGSTFRITLPLRPGPAA